MIENLVANTSYAIHDLLKKRWSPRAFSDRQVEKEKLLTILEAARWAPSTYNEQPWSFIVATIDAPTEHNRLLSCLVDANQRWAHNAPVLMISVAHLYFARNGKDNRHAFHDAGLALENLIIQAIALDLFVHPMAGFYPDKARELFNIPSGYEAVAAIALGYLGDPASLPEDLRQRELETRTRKPLSDFVFTGRWGDSPLISNPDRSTA